MTRPVVSLRRRAAGGLLAACLVLTAVTPGLAFAQDEAGSNANANANSNSNADPRSFAGTGYTITDDAVWSFFDGHGGVATFGEPISRQLTLMGMRVQLFQDAALQVLPDGSVRVLQLTEQGLLPYRHMHGLTLPAADPVIAYVAPSPDGTNYAARVQAFVQATVPDSWNNQPVGFFSTYTAQGGPDVWGLPTSSPAADPNNPRFVYQRFQNGVLLYDASAGTTSALPLGEYLKDVLTGQNLPADLAAEAAASPLLRQYDSAHSLTLARPGLLTETDLTGAFVADAG